METFLENPENWAFVAPEYRGENPAAPNNHMDSYSYGTIMCEVAQLREVRNKPTNELNLFKFRETIFRMNILE